MSKFLISLIATRLTIWTSGYLLVIPWAYSDSDKSQVQLYNIRQSDQFPFLKLAHLLLGKNVEIGY